MDLCRRFTRFVLIPFVLARADPTTQGQYQVAHTDQFSLDDILASRFMEYSGTLPENSTETPDFIFLPLFTMFLANPWHCHVPEFKSLILETVIVIRELVASLPPSSYPRIILPIAPIRYSMEDILLTPEIMSEIKNDVIVMSIEGAPNRHREGMDYVIDVPYPTWYHLLRAEGEQWQRSEEEDFMFNSERPYLYVLDASGGATDLRAECITRRPRHIPGARPTRIPSTASSSAPCCRTCS